MGKLKGLMLKIKKIKNIEIILAVIIGLIIVAIYAAPKTVKTQPEAKEQINEAEQLAAILSAMRGVGNAQVMITYESDGELVPASDTDINQTTNENGNQTTYSRKESNKIITVYEQGSTTALILKENKPQVRGVIVIAEGASDINVMLSIYKAVQTVLQIPAEKVDVFEMN